MANKLFVIEHQAVLGNWPTLCYVRGGRFTRSRESGSLLTRAQAARVLRRLNSRLTAQCAPYYRYVLVPV